EQLFLKIPIKN
ncbi:amiloride-sensitive sodium channel subunit alpha, partial [Nephila pilipes]